MNKNVRSIVGLSRSGLTTQCLQWLQDLLQEGVEPGRVLVLVRHSIKAKQFKTRFYQSYGTSLRELKVKGYASFVQSSLAEFWAEVLDKRPDLPPTFQPCFLTKDLTQFLLYRAFDRCPYHFERFKCCNLPEYKILDQIVSDGYIASNSLIPIEEIGNRLASAWIDQQDTAYLKMLRAIPCCLQHLRREALKHKVIDFGFQLELFSKVLLTIDRFWQSWDYLIVDNAEESSEVFLDFYQKSLTKGKKLFFAYTIGGGSSYTNVDISIATFIYKNDNFSYAKRYRGMGALGMAISEEIGAKLKFPIKLDRMENYTDRVKLLTETTYLKGVESMILTVENLLAENIPPDRIVILMPRFDQVVMQLLQHSSIANYCSFLNLYVSFLRYPVLRGMITVAQLMQTPLISSPSLGQISGMISLFIGTDQIRSMLLARSFDQERLYFKETPNRRISKEITDKFRYFVERLNFYQQQSLRLDLFWANIIREFSPNFRLTPTDRDLLNSLMGTAKRFFAAFPNFDNFQFLQMLLLGETPTILRQWEYEQKIIVATPLQFLKTDRETDYQFWFNISGAEWRKPIAKELLNHKVLTKNWQSKAYTPEDEQQLRTDQLGRTLLNLCCRNHHTIYLVKTQTNVHGQENYTDLDSKILQGTLPT